MDETRENMNHRDLVQFLLARLDEDEAIAEANRGRGYRDGVEWEQHNYSDNVWWPDTNAMVATGQWGDLDEAAGRHITRHDPARVLREVAAKREIITNCAGRIGGQENPGAIGDAEDIIRLLALPYSDHPDYRDEWRP